MSDKSEVARQRVDNTKSMSLDRRIEILVGILAALELTDPKSATPLQRKRIIRLLEEDDYEPMMFKHAMDIISSRYCTPLLQFPMESWRQGQLK